MDALKQYMALTKMSNAELAKRLGVSRMSLIQWLAGRTVPTAANIRRIHEVTGLSLEDLVPKEAA